MSNFSLVRNIETHKDCGGVIKMRNMPSELQWRCDKCQQIVPIVASVLHYVRTYTVIGRVAS